MLWGPQYNVTVTGLFSVRASTYCSVLCIDMSLSKILKQRLMVMLSFVTCIMTMIAWMEWTALCTIVQPSTVQNFRTTKTIRLHGAHRISNYFCFQLIIRLRILQISYRLNCCALASSWQTAHCPDTSQTLGSGHVCLHRKHTLESVYSCENQCISWQFESTEV